MNNPIDKTMYNLLLRNYPQYEVLRQELLKLFYRKALANGITVDCYVDLNSYLSSLYKRPDFIYDEPMSITASIVNFTAHLREFFASRFSIATRIFLIYGSTRPASAVEYAPDYDAHNAMDREAKANIGACIDENLNLLSILAPYLPQIYYVEDRNTEPAVLTRVIIKMESDKGRKFPRLIFTKDMFDYQLVATCPNTHIIRTKKTMQGDQTYTVSYFDFYKKLNKQLGLKTIIGIDKSPELYSLYMAFAGCRDRNLKAFINYPNTDKRIDSYIKSAVILNGYNLNISIDPSIAMILDVPEEIINRYKAVDILYQSTRYRLMPSFANITKGFVDLYDPESVRQINNQYFRKYPLDLNVL